MSTARRSTPPTLAVPDGYPLPAWADPGDTWGVPPELRPGYVAAAARGVGSADAYSHARIGYREVTEFGPSSLTVKRVPIPYDEWAHGQRYGAARQAHNAATLAAEHERLWMTDCECCGIRLDRRQAYAVDVRDRTALVCATCLPGIEAAARSVDLLADGRTRGDAQTALIGRLLAEADAGADSAGDSAGDLDSPAGADSPATDDDGDTRDGLGPVDVRPTQRVVLG